MEIWEEDRSIGTLHCQRQGLFWNCTCKIEKNREQIRRLYVQKEWQVEYLGIPDAQGLLTGRIPMAHFPNGIETALADTHARGDWRPWRGELDGVFVNRAYLRRDEAGMTLALEMQEAVKFPAWIKHMGTQSVFGQKMATVQLNQDGTLPVKEIESGGYTDETTHRDNFDFELSSDGTASVGIGIAGDEDQGRQADRPDI